MSVREIAEKLAELEHDQWVDWSKDLASKEKLSPERLARWKTLWKPYSELTEKEKDDDRTYSDKVLSYLGTLDIAQMQDLMGPIPLSTKSESYSLDPAVIAEPKTDKLEADQEVVADCHSMMDRVMNEHIEKLSNGQYRLVSHKGRNLGTYKRRKQAKEREQQVNYFKQIK